MKEEILNFINRRWKKDSDWTNGNCYWFAFILCERFPSLKMYYLPIDGHFIAGDGETFYDWEGEVHTTEVMYLFSDLQDMDPLWGSHLIRDCKM